MKKLKRMLVLMLCAGMTFMMCGIVSFATDGELRFSDPSTTVGATVDVTAKLSADDGLGSVSATLSYDSQYLRFVSGSGATDNGGQIQLTGDGGGSTEVSWTLQFQALAEGTTQITIASVSATDSYGSSVAVTQGNSTITIGPGDPSLITESSEGTSSGGGGSIEIDGQTYTVSTDIPDVLIPEGFVRDDMTYGGQTYAATRQEVGTMYAAYLANSEGEEDFYLYDPETEQFSPFEQVSVSDSRYVVVLSEDPGDQLPDYLQATTITINGKEFPAWQNMDASAYYVVYGLNSDGDKGYYQYDTLDSTYQRYIPESAEDTEEDTSSLGGVLNTLRNHLDKVILVVWGFFLFMLIVIIILAVKLRHRNLELDDLYDEYGIDLEEEAEETREEKKARKKAEKEAKKKKSKKKSEDDLYDFEDEDEEYDDEYDIDDESDEEDYEEEPFKEYRASDYEDDSEIDDLDEVLNARVRVKKQTKSPKIATVGPEQPRRVGHSEEDDTFKMDLIDLD